MLFISEKIIFTLMHIKNEEVVPYVIGKSLMTQPLYFIHVAYLQSFFASIFLISSVLALESLVAIRLQ